MDLRGPSVEGRGRALAMPRLPLLGEEGDAGEVLLVAPPTRLGDGIPPAAGRTRRGLIPADGGLSIAGGGEGGGDRSGLMARSGSGRGLPELRFRWNDDTHCDGHPARRLPPAADVDGVGWSRRGVRHARVSCLFQAAGARRRALDQCASAITTYSFVPARCGRVRDRHRRAGEIGIGGRRRRRRRRHWRRR